MLYNIYSGFFTYAPFIGIIFGLPVALSIVLREFYLRKNAIDTGESETHSFGVGCALLVGGGFFGLHRFYYGKSISGILYLLTFGFLGLGWLFDLGSIHKMHNETVRKCQRKQKSTTIAFLSLLAAGFWGGHRFYLGRWLNGVCLLVLNLFTYFQLKDSFVVINNGWRTYTVGPSNWQVALLIIVGIVWVREYAWIDDRVKKANTNVSGWDIFGDSQKPSKRKRHVESSNRNADRTLPLPAR